MTLPDRPTILHLGLGAFHRAHQADFTQDANLMSGQNWRIEAVSMRNPHLAQLLAQSGGQYTLVERQPHGPVCKPINVIEKTYVLKDDPHAVARRMADADINVLTITITEKGYGANVGAGRLDRKDPDVAQDLSAPGTKLQSLAGLLCAGLSFRREADLSGLTIISCDNLPSNGHLLKAIVSEFAEQTDPPLADWIAKNCTFPCTMVDRITPASAASTIEDAHGDLAAVETEPFRQWVIEDNFAGQVPDWASIGALIVRDVAPFEDAKLRLLNGAHTFLACAGALLDLQLVRDVMSDPVLVRALKWHMQSVALSLDPIPELDVRVYIDDLFKRFANPAMAHRCDQICLDGSQKLPQRVFQPAIDLLERYGSAKSCAMATALWMEYIVRFHDHPSFEDPLADEFRRVIDASGDDTKKFVAELGDLLGQTAQRLWSMQGWKDEVVRSLDALHRSGARRVLIDAGEGAKL